MQINGFNISKNIMSRIEHGERYVTDLELIAFARILNVSTAWLFHNLNPKNLFTKHSDHRKVFLN